MKYNIIGDIHCRGHWKEVIREDAINIFVGDYFSPYFPYPWEQQLKVFNDIVAYAREHMDTTVLLLGNHDFGHIHHETYSRHDFEHELEIKKLFLDNSDLFRVAYAIEDKAIVTHAGVSIVWYEKKKNKHIIGSVIRCTNFDEPDEIESPYGGSVPCTDPKKYSQCLSPEDAFNLYRKKYYMGRPIPPKEGQFMMWNDKMWRFDGNEFVEFYVSPSELADFINGLWNSGSYSAFNFENNAGYGDGYGDSESHGPMWIRPSALKYCNIYELTNVKQFVGHTMVGDIPIVEDGVCYCDCLARSSASALYDTDTDWITVNIIKDGN